MNPRKALVVVLVLLISSLMGSSSLAAAGPDNQLQQTPSEDFWCTIDTTTGACTATKNDSSNLRLQGNFGIAASAGIVRFNVATGWPIGKARLNLAYGYAGSCQAQQVNVQVYGTSNGNTDPPTRGSFLANVDGGIAQVPFPGTHTTSAAYNLWTDNTSGDGLVQYLEAARNNGGVATLWIEAPTTTGNIFFASSNGGLNCFTAGSYTLPGPVLQLADSAQPLSVEMSSSSAQQASSWPLYAGLGAVALFVVAGVMITRRRTA